MHFSVRFASVLFALQGAELNVRWAAPVGLAADPLAHEVAVCGDGSAYVSHRSGHLGVVSAMGEVTHRSIPPIAALSRSILACDLTGSLTLVNSTDVTKWRLERTGTWTKFAEYSIAHLGLKPTRAHQTAEGLYLLADAVSAGRPECIYRLDLENATTDAFDLGPDPIASSIRSKARGAIAWDATARKVAYLFENPFDVRLLDPAGRTVEAMGRPVVPAASRWAVKAVFQEQDRNLAMVHLSGMGFAVQSYELVPGTRSKAFVLTILDSETLAMKERIRLPGIGLLRGASADGTMYFLGGSPDGGVILSAVQLR